MADDTIITIIGNLTADPELRYTPSGAPVANFTIASTPRFFDRQANEWKDAEALFMRCALWREPAENVSESLRKGMRVIAQGRLKARGYEDREGNRRTAWELDVDDVGPSLRKATAHVTKTTGAGQGSFSSGHTGDSGGFGGGSANTYDATQNTGWGTPTQPGAGQGGWPTNEPAF